MLLSQREVNAVVVLQVQGKLVSTEDRGMLTDKVASLVFQGRKHIVLNLEGLTYMDSGGLGELVSCQSIAARQGSNVALASLGQRMQTLLVMSRLQSVFSIFPTENEAVDSFPAAPGA